MFLYFRDDGEFGAISILILLLEVLEEVIEEFNEFTSGLRLLNAYELEDGFSVFCILGFFLLTSLNGDLKLMIQILTIQSPLLPPKRQCGINILYII